jgi:hypothetical protein
MAVYSKIMLSGMNHGQALAITGVLPSSANTIHTAITGVTDPGLDEVWIWAYVQKDATGTNDRNFTITWGVSTATGALEYQRIPYVLAHGEGPVCVVPGWPLRNAQLVKGYATKVSEIAVAGYVNRIT